MLEWMQVVLHTIYQVYKAPDRINRLKQKPLVLGIIGAVISQLVVIFVGEYLIQAKALMHVVVGAFLVRTGAMNAFCKDEDDDPSQRPSVLWSQRKGKLMSTCNGSCAVPVSGEGSPIARIIHMISDLQAKTDGEDEVPQQEYNEFTERCEKHSENLQLEIGTGKSIADELSSKIADEEAWQPNGTSGCPRGHRAGFGLVGGTGSPGPLGLVMQKYEKSTREPNLQNGQPCKEKEQ